jgi:hypothetical protein
MNQILSTGENKRHDLDVLRTCLPLRIIACQLICTDGALNNFFSSN